MGGATFWSFFHKPICSPWFQALCKDLERGEVKKWLKQILEILMAERGKEERTEQVCVET
jgi:hypothetical protein